MQYCQLWYYIPDTVVLPNPSYRMRSIGVRVDLSVWVLPKERTPWDLIKEYTDAGAKLGTVDYAHYETPALTELIKAALEEEIKSVTRALNTSQRINARRADTATFGPERSNYRKRGLAMLARAKRLLRATQNALDGFGLDALAGSMEGAWMAIEARRIEMEMRAARYVQMANQLGAHPSPVAQEMAKEARANALPAGIGAGFLGDEAHNERDLEVAQEVSEAFGTGGSW